MAKQSLIEAFNVKPRKLDTKAVNDYDIFPDKDLLDKLRSKIIQDLRIQFCIIISVCSKFILLFLFS